MLRWRIMYGVCAAARSTLCADSGGGLEPPFVDPYS
jgi:hypothetical protein